MWLVKQHTLNRLHCVTWSKALNNPADLCIPAAMLILAELHNVSSDVSELQVGVTIVPEVF